MSTVSEQDANAVAKILIAQRNQALDEVVACRLELDRMQRRIKELESGLVETSTQ